MALEIISRDRNQEKDMGKLVADRELCLTADRQTVVEAGDVRSAFVLCSKGRDIASAEVARLGLTQDERGRIVVPGSKPAEPTPHPILAMKAEDAVAHVAALATLELLAAAEAAEAARAKGARKSVLDAIGARLDELSQPKD